MTDPLVSILLAQAPRGKGRHRSRIVMPKFKKPFVHQYADPETVAYEAEIAAAGAEAMAGWAPFPGPLTVFVEAFFPIPASWSGKKRAAAAAGEIFHTSKPDGDNIFKAAGDALNGVCWVDDSQIVMTQCLKVYSDFPRLRISVWSWDDVEAAEPELL
jgi:Holliday junction resolvase RusA-like endonuclease